jgi:hypothetical protein
MRFAPIAAFFAALSFALPVHATPQLRNLLAAISATGTSIVVDHPQLCKDQALMGRYTYERNVVDQLLICAANHRGDNAELYDTILHESVHVAQACKGGPLYSSESIIKAATPKDIQLVGTGYPNSQFNEELEARVIAQGEDEVYVTNLITQHCK